MVDVSDALTSARPYRAPVSHGEAIAEIKKGNGKHFDPKVVEIFSAIDRGASVKERYQNTHEDLKAKGSYGEIRDIVQKEYEQK